MSNFEFDRSSRSDVFRVLDELLPTPEARQSFAELAARAIEAVHRVEPRGWGLTVQQRRICLNLGSVAFLGVSNDEAWVLVLDDQGATPPDVKANVYKGVKSFPGSRWLGVPAAQFGDLAERARTSIDRLLDRVLKKAWVCNYRESHTPAAVEYMAERAGRTLPQPVLPVSKVGSGAGFADLIEEFLATYWPTGACRQSMALYASSRTEARKNLDRALQLRGSGPESKFHEAVLGGLIPHDWNARNIEGGKWISVTPAGMKDIAKAAEGKGIIAAAEWPAVTRAIVRFVEESTAQPDQIERTCSDFLSAVPRGFQAGVLSPILGALAPASFVTVNRKSLAVLATLGGPRLTARLDDYSAANRAIRTLLEQNAELFERPEFQGHRVEDIFDHFCHWMEAVRGKSVTPRVVTNESDDERPWLSARAFELFERLRQSPSKETYNAAKEEIQREIEEPFRDLFRRLRNRLPERIVAACETEKNLVAKILKNDWGRGGANPYLWGAFYPRGGQRVRDAQLFVVANADLVRFGFGLETEDAERRREFGDRLISDQAELIRDVPDAIGGQAINFDNVGDELSSDQLAGSSRRGALAELIRARGVTRAHVMLPRERVLNTPRAELERLIAATFEGVFPLFMRASGIASSRGTDVDEDLDATSSQFALAQHSVPATATDPVRRNPPFSLDDLARESSLAAR